MDRFVAHYGALHELQNCGAINAYMRHSKDSPKCTVYRNDGSKIVLNLDRLRPKDLRSYLG